MLTLRKVAVTGGIASGKSTFCSYLKKYGATVVDADKIIHGLLHKSSPATPLGQQILQLLGQDILVGNHLNREKIAKKVFNHPKKLEALEKLLHPHVFQEITKLYEKAKKKRSSLFFVVEIPLLFETKSEKNYHFIVTIVREENRCRKGNKIKDYDQRKQRMLPLKEKIKKSDFVIENNGTLEELEEKAKHLVEILTKMSQNKPFRSTFSL